MLLDRPQWKQEWEQTKEHYRRWWRREGHVLTLSGLPPLDEPRDRTPWPPEPRTARARHTDPEWFAWNQRLSLSRLRYPADNLPIAHTDLGCVQLAACLGSEPEFDEETVWYNDRSGAADEYPTLALTRRERWWRAYKRIMLRVLEVSRGDFLVGMPAFGSNLDISIF